jgi:hypothetical protein
MNAVLFIAAAIALGAYVCRLDALHWRQHRISVVLIHLLQACSCAWVITQAAQGLATWEHASITATALGWLWVTFWSWRNGPPAHALRRAYISVRS